MLVALYLAHFCSSLTDAVNVECFTLYLAQLNAETSKFHLCIDTSKIFYLSLVVPTAEVTCMIHLYRTSPTVFFNEGTRYERLRCSLRQSPIASSYLDAGETQLARYTLWYEITCGIDDKVPVVCYTLTYRNVFRSHTRSNTIIRCVVGTLCRTIYVDNLNMVAIYTIHLFSTTCGETDWQVVEGVQQQTCHCRRVSATSNLVVEEELTYLSEVLANLCRHDVERST